MTRSFEWLGLLGVCTLVAACSSGSSNDDDDPAAGRGGGSSGSAGSNAGKGGTGRGGQGFAGAQESSAGTDSAGGGSAGGSDGDGGCCVDEALSWGRVGGHVVTVATSTLEPCAVYTHERAPVGETPTNSCTQGLAVACGEDGLGPDDVLAALGDSDVQAALAGAPVLYGTDPRPYDGQLLQITIGDAVIEIGDDCMEQDCVSIPEGVQALADLLLSLDEQELASSPCGTVF